MLSIKNLSKVYPGGKKAVNKISLEIESGSLLHLLEQVGVVKQLH